MTAPVHRHQHETGTWTPRCLSRPPVCRHARADLTGPSPWLRLGLRSRQDNLQYHAAQARRYRRDARWNQLAGQVLDGGTVMAAFVFLATFAVALLTGVPS